MGWPSRLESRIWAAGHLQKSREVTRSGPYKWTRHPLYVGSGIIALGVVIAARSALVALLGVAYIGITIPMAIRQAYRAATKENRGEQRTQMAYELAVHLVTHNCGLAQVIVAELFSSYEKMLWMLDQDTDVLTPLLAEKLKSV